MEEIIFTLMKKLYFAPINIFGHYVFRHLILLNGANYAFSELLLPDDFLKKDKKFKIIESDVKKTIFQIGCSNNNELINAVNEFKKRFDDIVEINLNMGCPQSTMRRKKICSGILYDLDLMKELSKTLVDECKKKKIIPSVKIRMGTKKEKIEIEKYLEILEYAGVKKVYIHARTLMYNYTKPAMIDEIIKLDLKKKFPSIELIYNGDIDSYDKYKLVEEYFDGVMIGRSALSNPLIFSQIRKKESERTKRFDVSLNDKGLIYENGKCYLSKEKEKIILDFVELCKKENLDNSLIKNNLKYLFKGVSDKDLSLRKLTNESDGNLLKIITNEL
jgi:tRNA-dihydrouridine synthase B